LNRGLTPLTPSSLIKGVIPGQKIEGFWAPPAARPVENSEQNLKGLVAFASTPA
jgi:hypothetical protein